MKKHLHKYTYIIILPWLAPIYISNTYLFRAGEMRNGRPKAAVLILLLALFVLTGPPGTLADNTGSSSPAAAVANTAVAYTSSTNTTAALQTADNVTTTALTAGNVTTTALAASSTILRNLTIGYLTAARGKLDNRQGLSISGALTLALEEVSIL